MNATNQRPDDDFNDSLDDLLGGPVVNRPRPAPPVSYVPRDFSEPCSRCRGTGTTPWGPCFKCRGAGKKTFKTSPEARAVAATRRVENRMTKFEERKRDREAWEAAHEAEVKWLREAARRNDERGGSFDFPINMINAINSYSGLTENQLAAVQRLMARDAERATARAAERAEREANAPAVNVSKIEEAFAKARANHVRTPKLRLDTFTFSAAPASGKNPGAIYVKESEEYLGKIAGGRFVCVATCGEERSTRIATAANDPEAAAIAYGRRFSNCAICGRELTKGVSIDRGIGPICAARFGW
jgi:hypothetical protein